MLNQRVHPAIKGAALGLSWGIAMRLWMRFISTDPEFSWSGTGFILGATTLAGMLLGFGWAAWSENRGNVWRAIGLAILPLGMGAGMIMLPTVLLGGMGLGRKTWPTWLRAALIVAAIGFQGWFFATAGDLPPGRTLPALLIYGSLISLEALAFSIPFLPSRTPSVVPVPQTS
ncbi:MAG: hypothetical protein ACT4OP_05495 [Actinomycetota bacterium]